MRTNNLRRMLLATTSAVVALGMLSLNGAPASAASDQGPGAPNPGPPSRDGQCVTGDGVNLNVLLGVPERIVHQPFCSEVLAGESYIPLGYWYTDTSYSDAPSPYPLARATPMEDFLAKLVAVHYVVDPGTRQARTYRFAAGDVVKARTLDQVIPDAAEFPIAFLTAALPPLPPRMSGHAYELSVEMSAAHCDGLGTTPSNCLPAGISLLRGCPFGVAPAAFQTEKSVRPS